jgi:hypothetical protein
MQKTLLIPVTLVAVATWGSNAIAQPMYPDNPDMRPMPPKMMKHPMPHPRFAPPRMERPPMPEFPSAEQLARMAPPEPITAEQIKERFAKRRAAMEKSMDRDRKAAEKYAKDFARLQKYRADRLAEIMAQAEERRQEVLKRLDEQEQAVLQRFNDDQQGGKRKPAEAKKPESET